MCILLSAFIVSGCTDTSSTAQDATDNPRVTEEEAKQIAIESESENNISEESIKAVSHKNSEYIVDWEMKEDCASGTVYVDDENGQIIGGTTSMC